MATLLAPEAKAVAKASERPQIQQHYVVQAAISATLIQALRKLWPTIDQRNLGPSLERYSQLATALVQRFSRASVAASMQNYTEVRKSAGITSPYRPDIIPPPTMAQVTLTVKTAAEDLWDKPGQTEALSPAQVTIVQERIEGSLQKLTMDTGRNEMIAAIEKDRYARGFARVSKPGACSFCRMLATRGAVYKTAQSAGAIGVTLLEPLGLADVNRYHTNCHCTVEPLFGRHYEMAAHVRDDKAIYDEVTKDETGADKAKAFRRAIEDRADGPTRNSKKRKRTRSGRPAADPSRDVDASKSKAELKATLADLEKSATKFSSPGTEARIADLRRKIAARG